jgi:hypothetical protein
MELNVRWTFKEDLKLFLVSDVEFKSVVVGPEDVIGDVAVAPDIVSDYLTTNRTFHAAAVIGFLKKICGKRYSLIY